MKDYAVSGTPMKCPSSMCPLIAPDGSPWTGVYDAICPGHDDLDKGGCPWWSMACHGGEPHREAIEDADRNGGSTLVIGPRKPKRLKGNPRSYDCPKAAECRWQEQAEASGHPLCPPREALKRGLDPRICNF